MKHKLILAAASAAVVGVSGAAGLGIASAQTNSPGQTLADRIAQRFNLDKADVQKVFDEERAAHQAKHVQKVNERIDQATKDGKISQTLADQLKAKLADVRALRGSLDGKTPEEHHQAVRAKMQELKEWADANNIPPDLVHPRVGRRMHHAFTQ